MNSVLSRRFGGMRILRHGLAALFLALAGAAYGQSTSDYAVVDDVTIYYAILPAEMLRTFPPGSAEAGMHGGIPGGKHVHHLQIVLFDVKTSARIDEARISVTVAELGLGGVTKTLEPFQIGDALTYGGYFEFRKRDLYEIRIQATLPETGRVITKTFEYRHQ